VDELTGKVGVVTGAASGIGRAMAHRFGSEGMHVVLADIDGDSLDEAVHELTARGVEAVGHVTDVALAGDVEDLAAATLETFGAVHVVCNNAGIGGGGPVAGFDVEAWRRIIDIDLWGVLHGMRVFLPMLIEQGEGHVVNTASAAGLFSAPFMGPYAVSKHGVVAISEGAFHELSMVAPGVAISVLCPGWVRTNIVAGMAPGEPDEPVDPMAEVMRETLRTRLETGMDPAHVADQVVDAIVHRRFYILTHPDTGAVVRKRMEAIISGDDPAQVGIDDF
jgi:NAD(P)-dependent dehydrogenase (short-subunit alcohol dehydrogenase family)